LLKSEESPDTSESKNRITPGPSPFFERKKVREESVTENIPPLTTFFQKIKVVRGKGEMVG